jgi:mono/diheme cytochrome c family protein
VSPARRSALTAVNVAGLALALACVTAAAQDRDTQFSPAQIKTGADIYARNCAPCHGPRMADPQGASNLRIFPYDQKSRFVVLVTRGKHNMPPWGDLLKPEDIEALWAYVVAGEQ